MKTMAPGELGKYRWTKALETVLNWSSWIQKREVVKNPNFMA